MKHSRQGLDGDSLKLFSNRVASLTLLLSFLLMLVVSMGVVQALAASSECDRSYDGDLVVEGNRELEITGETVCVHGNITVKDNAKLAITNATLRIFGTNKRIEVHDSACLTLDHVSLETSDVSTADEPLFLGANDEAKVKIESVSTSIGKPFSFDHASGYSQVIIHDSSFADLRVFNRANVSVVHSKILERVDLFFGNSTPVEVTGLKPGHIDHWEFDESDEGAFHLSIHDAEIESWLVDVGDKANVVIKDCVLSGLVLSPNGISGTLSGLHPGTFSSWSLHANNDVNCMLEAKLVNTKIGGWFLHFTNQARLTICNSDLAHIQVSRGYADLSLRSVHVRGVTGWDTLGKIDFDESSITQGIEFSNATLTLTGNVSISPDCYVSEWQSSTIIRDFPVVVEKDFDTPASQMPIEITLPNGRKLNQTTDENGMISFQCTFTDATYQDTYQLLIVNGSKEIAHSVGFLSSTPVAINLLRANTSSDALFVATAGELSSLDPYNVELRDNGSVFPNVYEPLFLMDIISHSPAVPLIATDVPSLDNGLIVLNEDGSCDITLPIRSGVLLHDGTPLSPADVEYSLELSMLLDTKDALSPTLVQAVLDTDSCADLIDRAGLEEVCNEITTAVEVQGETVILHLKKHFSPRLESLAKFPVVSKAWAISRGGWDGTPQDWTRYYDLPQEESPFRSAANGTGPFMVDKFIPGEQLLLKRNKGYWRGPARLKWVVINEIKDWTQLPQSFQTGQLDMIDYRSQRPEFAEQIALLKSIPNVNVFDCTPSLGISFMSFNRLVTGTSDKQLLPRGKLDESSIPVDFFADPDVRKGFIYAFDFPTFAQSALFGNAQRRSGPMWGDCQQSGINYTYDPAKAVEYFRKAFGGRLWNTGFTVSITYNKGNEVRQIAAETIKRDIESLNPKFHIVISAIPFELFVDKLFDDSLPLLSIGLTPSGPKTLEYAYVFMHSKGLFGEEEMPICDELIEEAYHVMDIKQRDDILCQLVRLSEENSMGVFWQQSKLHVQQQWVEGCSYAGYSNNVETIYFYPIWKELDEG